jgi:serine/threonine-protein kinase
MRNMDSSETVPPPAGIDDDQDSDEYEDSRRILNTLTIGSIVDGKYHVDQVLGRGSMGVVVAATHTQLGERVALKFLRIKENSGGEDFKSRFRREAKVSAKLKNEHIARVIDVGVWRDKVPYMVMEYLVGNDLSQVCRKNGPLPMDVVLDYSIQICAGIAEAHAHGIVHRDLKTSNIFVTKRPDGSDLIKILDFGISKWSDGAKDELTRTGIVLGTPKYMAPEQVFRGELVDARSDLWSIGAIIHVLLTGKAPFDFPPDRIYAALASNSMPPSIAELREDVPPEFEAALFKCFARDPQERVQNAAELAGSLLDAIGSPMAESERHRIAAILDPSMATAQVGSWRQQLSSPSSGSSPRLTSTLAGADTSSIIARRANASKTSSTAVSAELPPTKISGRRSGILMTAVLLALAVTTFLLFTRRGSEESKVGGASKDDVATTTVADDRPRTGAASSSTMGGGTDRTQGDPPATSDSGTATSASAGASAAAAAAAAAAAVPPKYVPRGRPKWTPPETHNKPTSQEPVAPPPQTTTAPTPPQPTSTKKLNPLEDRQ